MRLTRFFLDNYHLAVIVFLLMLAGGVFSFFTMPRMENPATYISGGTVFVIYPGAGPADMENLVAIPLEEAINELDEIRKINTTLRHGIATISVEFEHGTDAREKYSEMVSAVNAVSGRLPEDIHSMEFIQWTSTDVAIMQMAFVSETAEFHELERNAEQLKRRIERAGGVRKVELHAIPARELRVSPDLAKMAAMNISPGNVMDAIRSNNANIPGGTLSMNGRSFSIKTSGAFGSPSDLERTVVGSYNGQLVYLENIADVGFMYEDNNYLARFMGKRAIFLTVQQKEGVNIFTITDEINRQIREYENSTGDDIHLVRIFDQSLIVDRRINGFLNNLYQGIFLVGLFIFLSLGVRSSLIVILAIPASVLIGLGIVNISGFALEQISIAALVVALGLLVDNSIVMVENTNRYFKKGYPARQASLLASSEVGWPVTSATITTILAFIPIMLLPDKAGDFIRSLPVTIIATLGVSLFLTLTMTPFFATWLFRQQEIVRTRRNWRVFERFINYIVEGPYTRLLESAMKRKAITLFAVIAVFAVSAWAFTVVGVSFFPKAETPQLMIQIEMPEGTDIKKTDRAARWVESVLDTIPGVKHYSSNVGKGNPRIYYNHFARQHASHFAEIYVELEEYDARKFGELTANLRSVFSGFPGARINIREFEQGVPVEAPVAIYITGDNVDVLRNISRDVEEMLGSSRGAVNIENILDRSQTDLYFSINREKAGIFGVPVHEIDRTIRMAVNGITVSRFRDHDGREYDIVIRLPREEEIRLSDLHGVFVPSLTGEQLPLKQLANVEFVTEPSLISRFNMQRNASVLADIRAGYTLDQVINPVLAELSTYPFPEGYGYHIAGELEHRRDTFAGMTRAIIITIISIFGVLVFQFRSFLQPMIIFSAVPLAIIGSVWMLLITGNTFSFTAFVGLISLTGIVINNSIILVDFANRLRAEGRDTLHAAVEAGKTRFMPIFLTSVTTIGGLLPLTLRGGTLWAPMGWTIIGGLAASTLLTLVVVPVLYQLLSTETVRPDISLAPTAE
jgi:multidrug efflux pump subunit AcrB